MGHKDDSTFSPLMEEGSPQATLIDYVQARQRKRSLRDVTIVFSCFALLAWCGYLTLSVRDGVFEMKLAKIEMRKIEDVVNDVVAAMPSEKNKEVVKANVHIQEHGVNYQQSITYDPWTQIARIHNPQHLDLDDTITLMHKPSGMMLMLNNNHKHCEYSAMPEGMDPEGFAKASKEVEDGHRTLTMDSQTTSETMTGTIQGEALTEEEREDLHPEMQTLCEGLDIFHITKVELPANSANFTELEIPEQGGRVKRDISCDGPLVHKCNQYKLGWGRNCMWVICEPRMVGTEICAKMYNHYKSNYLACVICCKDQASSSLCKCSTINDMHKFTSCQRQMDCNLGNTRYC